MAPHPIHAPTISVLLAPSTNITADHGKAKWASNMLQGACSETGAICSRMRLEREPLIRSQGIGITSYISFFFPCKSADLRPGGQPKQVVGAREERNEINHKKGRIVRRVKNPKGTFLFLFGNR